MNNCKYILGLFVISICCYGCSEDLFTQVVDIEIPEHNSGISIGAEFLQRYNDVVRLQATKGIQEVGDLENIVGASVVLKKGDVVIKVFEDQSMNSANSAGFYVNEQDLELEAGEAYTLEVEKNGFSKATSTQVMPDKVEITNLVYTEEGHLEPDGFRSDEISITFTDPNGIENYYGIKARVYFEDSNGNTYSDEIFLQNRIDPLIEEGVNLGIVFSDGAIDGRAVTFDFNFDRTFKDQPDAKRIDLQFFNITEDKYLHERSLRIYEDSDFNPFVEPVIVHENVEGGHGLFSLSYSNSYSIDIN